MQSIHMQACGGVPSVRPTSLMTSAKSRHSLMLLSKLLHASDENTRLHAMPTPSRNT